MRWGLVLVLAFGIAACGGDAGPDTSATATRSAEQTAVSAALATPTLLPTATPAQQSTIQYVIKSKPAAIVSLTYENETGGTAQEDGIRTPWTKTMTMDSGDFAYISAQGNQYAAEITCEIRVNGQLGATSTSSGSFVITTCSGRVP